MHRAVSKSWIHGLAIGAAAALFALAACTDGTRGPPPGGPSGQAGAGGTSGAAGTGGGGTGGSAGHVSNNDGLYPSWWGDDSIWETPLEGRFAAPGCTILAADSAKIPLSPLEWTSCGVGCEKADIARGLERSVLPRLSASVIDGQETPYLATIYPVVYMSDNAGKSARILFGFIDLEASHTVAAVQMVREPIGSLCVQKQMFDIDALHVAMAAKGDEQTDDDPSSQTSGTWDPASKRWIWQKPPREASPVDGGCSRVVLQDGGRTFYFCPYPNAIMASLTPGSSEISVLAELGDDYAVPIFGAAENREMVIWPEFGRDGSGSRVRGWDSKDGGPRTLISSIPGYTLAVGLSPSWFYGARIESETDARATDAAAGKFTLWYSPRLRDGKEPPITFSPVITNLPLSPSKIRATDGWMAVQLAWMSDEPEDSPRIFPLLVRTSDWKRRWFGALGNKSIVDFTLTKTHFYAVYTDQRFEGATDVYRYDLTEFDSIGLPFE